MKLKVFLGFLIIFEVQAIIFEARTVIFEARGAIWTILGIIVIFDKKKVIVLPPPGRPKIHFLRSREVAVFSNVLVAGFL